jgi:hypothetical protein
VIPHDRRRAKAPSVVPIPGTLHVARLEENSGAASLALSADELVRLDTLPVHGARETELGHNWSYGTTPTPPEPPRGRASRPFSLGESPGAVGESPGVVGESPGSRA